MQLSIYYTKDDEWLIEKVEAEAKTQRKSKTAVILSILEKHFQKEKRLGEILGDIGFLSDEELTKALDIQKKKEKKRKLLGEILLDEGFIEEKELRKSLSIQKNKKH